jgi:hypothetical protein
LFISKDLVYNRFGTKIAIYNIPDKKTLTGE